MVSQHRGQRDLRIAKAKLLLVEGNDDYWFFRRLIEKRQSISGLEDSVVQIIEFAQSDKLSRFLTNVIVPALATAPTPVRVLGVVRDADQGFTSAFQSIQDSLRNARLPVPAAPNEISRGQSLSGGTLDTTAYIMPDNSSPGDLETLCLNAVRDASAMSCVDGYFECLQSVNHVPRQESKARLRAFLASNLEDPTLLAGNAIAAGVIPWNSPAFNGVHQFLDMLDAVN